MRAYMQAGAALSAALAALLPGGVMAAQPLADLVPHRAVYEVSVGRPAEVDVDVRAAGEVTMRAEKTCKGWRLMHRLEVALVIAGQEPLQMVSQIAFDETSDGTRLDFASSLQINGETVERSKGNARLDTAGKPGQVFFQEPEEELKSLPPETVLPVRAFAVSMGRLLQGERVVEQLVFDGSDPSGPVRISDLLLGEAPALEARPRGDTSLATGPFLRILSSYIDPGTTDSEPRSVQRADINAAGVTGRWSFNIDAIPLQAELSEIEALPEPAC